MKTQFELKLDINGRPCIKFRHYDKESSLEQEVLKVFIEGANKKGIELIRSSSYRSTNGDSWEGYEIKYK